MPERLVAQVLVKRHRHHIRSVDLERNRVFAGKPCELLHALHEGPCHSATARRRRDGKCGHVCFERQAGVPEADLFAGQERGGERLDRANDHAVLQGTEKHRLVRIRSE